jgi:hypothetical protein
MHSTALIYWFLTSFFGAKVLQIHSHALCPAFARVILHFQTDGLSFNIEISRMEAFLIKIYFGAFVGMSLVPIFLIS